MESMTEDQQKVEDIVPPESDSGPSGDDGFSGHKAVQIVKINEDDHSFTLDEDALNKILNNERIKDRPVCVVSVAGAFRRGKSFLLDFLLRYLRRNGRDDWMGEKTDDKSPLTGFHWRGGSERDTTGILMWSEVFEAQTKKGKDVAILLMDTQGAFDSNSTVRDCATIFALSAMVSSVLVYNLTQNIQEDDLQHLNMFTEYGRLAMEDTGDTPFQRLQFLVRDWSYPYEAEYGADGGAKILSKRLQVSEYQHPELQALRKHINGCFERIDGFLLPHPGLNVATNPNFDGRLCDIEPLFKQHLNQFVPLLLSPDNVTVRKISGQEVRCKELVRYLRAYVDIFKGDEMPEPKSMLAATSEANNLASLSEAKDYYIAMMEGVCGGDKAFVNEHILEIEHLRIRDAALDVFSSRRKMGGEEFSAKYREQLEREVDESYENYRLHNDSKNIFKAANTPITMAAIAAICYITSQVFAMIGLYPVANLLNLVMMATFILLSMWAYVRYSGNLTELGAAIDSGAGVVWESGLLPLFNKTAEAGTQYAARSALQRLNSTVATPSASGLATPPMSVKKHA